MKQGTRIPALAKLLPFGALAGCAGAQSALQPTGAEASDIGTLFWTVTGISILTFLLVLTFMAGALKGSPGLRRRISDQRTIVACGIVLPVFVLTGLLTYGLLVMEAGSTRSASAEGPGITIVGKRWWWRVVYETPDGREVVSANELRLPVGRPVAIRLETEDVIHSFWAPQLGGKLDMIPGRTNVLTVEATEAGISRAQCAEYCGGAHAMMAMFVVALPPDGYDAWLAAEAQPAASPVSALAAKGEAIFAEYGCGACHTVRGTGAAGIVGPDLTHVGARHSLAAATLANDHDAFVRWIAQNQHIKPGNLMPPFDMLTPEELAALGTYLDGLE